LIDNTTEPKCIGNVLVGQENTWEISSAFQTLSITLYSWSYLDEFCGRTLRCKLP